MSTMAELRRLFAYNCWATLRVLDAAQTLTSEELERDLKSSFPSVGLHPLRAGRRLRARGRSLATPSPIG